MIVLDRRIRRTVRWYMALGLAAWTAILGLSLAWTVDRQRDVTEMLAVNTARANFDKDQAYRFWAASHGGVYVPPTDKTPPSPWLAHLPDRDVVTTDGRALTLMNPAYMLRQMMKDFDEWYGIKGRIVGIVALNPDNLADPWEADAIRRFDAGEVDEVQEFVDIDGAPHLRYIKPMVMGESCQKCHGHLGFPNGSVRGAVGIAVPMAPYLDAERQALATVYWSHGGAWGLGVLTIAVIGWRSGRRLMETARVHEETRLAAHVFGNAPDATIITDAAGTILRTNPAFTAITGYSQDEVVGRSPRIFRSDHHGNDYYRTLRRRLLSEGRWQGEVWNRRKDGEFFVAWESIVTVRDDAGNACYFIASFSDITEKMEDQARIQHLANYDVLTNLPNRVLFHDRLDHALAKAARDRGRLALLFLDLDGFKKINDTMGHGAGDELLKEMAARLRTCVRSSDTIARLGGDEFAVVLEEVSDGYEAAAVAEKILQALSAPVTLAGRDLIIGVSIGIGVFPEDGETSEILIQHADTAMYEAKARGRNRFHFYRPEMTVREERRFELETSLRAAIEAGQFRVHYQPKLCVRTEAVCGFEALVRWQHPQLGLVSPADFVPLAEELRLIRQIDLMVLREACRQGRLWMDGGHPVGMAVNLSGIDLGTPGLPEDIAAILAETGFPADHLELEITESCVLELSRGEGDVLAALKALGVRLAIDDFGTGYSSLGYLKQLPVDTLKIDRSFIREMVTDSRDALLVATMIKLAHSLDLKVVAEGIEAEDQRHILAEHDCDEVQGFLYARPLTAADAEVFLRRGDRPLPAPGRHFHDPRRPAGAAVHHQPPGDRRGVV